MDHRLAAAKVLVRVLGGDSLSKALPNGLQFLDDSQKPTVQALVYGVLRHYESLDALSGLLLKKAFKTKDKIIFALLLIGLFELRDQRTASHAVVNELVKVVKTQRQWASGLVNACLRRYQRETDELESKILGKPEVKMGLPQWWIDRLSKAWPGQMDTIAAQLAIPAPMTLRVNLDRGSREQYQVRLKELGIESTVHPIVNSALQLVSPVDVSKLPGFDCGDVSVQDAAAQLAGQLLQPECGQRILDACSAPGGKMAHLLEQTGGDVHLTAVEFDAARSERVTETLARLGYSANVVVADAGKTSDWWDGQLFDRILLDAPCSATGTVRRNPDVKRHRKASDIADLVETQALLLQSLWEILAPGGMLVYATCSIMPEENESQVTDFIGKNPDAVVQPFSGDWGHAAGAGRQILPGEDGMDGFYFACMSKQ